MSGDGHDVDPEIVLPAGMELVVPPPPAPVIPAATTDQGEPGREASGDTQPRRADAAAREARRRPPAA